MTLYIDDLELKERVKIIMITQLVCRIDLLGQVNDTRVKLCVDPNARTHNKQFHNKSIVEEL